MKNIILYTLAFLIVIVPYAVFQTVEMLILGVGVGIIYMLYWILEEITKHKK